MTEQIPKELGYARELIDQAKLDEALEIVELLENEKSLSPENQLSALLFKARIYIYKHQERKAQKFSERAFLISEKLGLTAESVEALIGKANIGMGGDLDKADSYISDAERRLNSLADDSTKRMLRRYLLEIKSWILIFNRNFNGAAESAQECLKLTEEEKLGNKLDLAGCYSLVGWVNVNQGNLTEALKYVEKSLVLNKKLNLTVRVAQDYSLLARIYQYEGNLDKALKYCNKSLMIKEISKRDKLAIFTTLTTIYRLKSEINQALEYLQRALALSEELNLTEALVMNLNQLGYLNRIIGNYNKVKEYVERSLILSERWGFIWGMARALTLLIRTYIDEKSRKKANRYFSRLSDLYNQTKDKGDVDIYFWYLVSKAYMLKTSIRMRDRAEAQVLFRELVDITYGEPLIFSMGNLCDLLFEELSRHNDPEILDEISPLIAKSLDMAEKVQNYHWLAETKLLQAKLAFIQMDIEEAKRLMVQAQRIADLHGLNLLAYGISSEHDKLLEQVDVRDIDKKEITPISERIKLASTSEVLERIQGKRAVEPAELVDEEPILLLIMDDSGATYFNHPFILNWDYSDLFSSFMSAFNTFSSEIFSKSIDRIRVGENTILINPVDSFLACYVIKGQSYPALQKLTRFSKAIKENSEIWQALNKSVKTSEMLELDKPPVLKTVIDEIF